MKPRLRCSASALTISLALLAPAAHGAACCGGGFAAPALVAGDEARQLSISYGYALTQADVTADSLWHRRSARASTETWRAEAAQVFADRWQAGASLPIVRRARGGASATGAGDLSLLLGFEALPDWDYHPWRPKGLVFLELTAPTGRSTLEATAPFQLDGRGRGLWAAGLGSLLTKSRGSWDFFASFRAHRAFPRAFASGAGPLQLRPGWGGEAGFGAGWNPGDFRLGAALAWSYEDPLGTRGAVNSRGAPQRLATATLSVSHVWRRLYGATLSYADQTLFGSPLNTQLQRGLTLLLQRRWER